MARRKFSQDKEVSVRIINLMSDGAKRTHKRILLSLKEHESRVNLSLGELIEMGVISLSDGYYSLTKGEMSDFEIDILNNRRGWVIADVINSIGHPVSVDFMHEYTGLSRLELKRRLEESEENGYIRKVADKTWAPKYYKTPKERGMKMGKKSVKRVLWTCDKCGVEKEHGTVGAPDLFEKRVELKCDASLDGKMKTTHFVLCKFCAVDFFGFINERDEETCNE